MPLLLHLDGLPGAGKTTLARLWAAEHPGTLCLDIDLVRRSLGGWRDHLGLSGHQARRLAYGMAALHLRDGYDVVVPQYAVSREFVVALVSVAEGVGADHLLVVLDAGAEARSRLDARTLAAREAQHVEAGEVIARKGFPPYAPLEELAASVPGAVVLETHGRSVEQSYEDLVGLVRRRTG